MAVKAGHPLIRTSLLLKLAGLILLVLLANLAAAWIVDSLQLEIKPSTEDTVHRTIMLSAAAYVVLIAIPFVPGAEIGLLLLGMLGPPIVFLVYVCTLVGLSASFVVGRLVPMQGLIHILDDLRLTRASRLLEEIQPLDMKERLAFLAAKAPNRVTPFLLRNRYLTLAVVINLPGNIVIGGGGGIALVAGASGLYSLPGFLATICVAVSPLPLAVFFFGRSILTG